MGWWDGSEVGGPGAGSEQLNYVSFGAGISEVRTLVMPARSAAASLAWMASTTFLGAMCLSKTHSVCVSKPLLSCGWRQEARQAAAAHA